jgi:hypothetical protein
MMDSSPIKLCCFLHRRRNTKFACINKILIFQPIPAIGHNAVGPTDGSQPVLDLGFTTMMLLYDIFNYLFSFSGPYSFFSMTSFRIL